MAEEKCRGCGEWVTHTEWLGFCRPCAEKRGMVPEARRCKICKWWDRCDDGDYGEGACENDKVDRGSAGVHVYEDSRPIHTGPEFGCVHWEARTPDGDVTPNA